MVPSFSASFAEIFVGMLITIVSFAFAFIIATPCFTNLFNHAKDVLSNKGACKRIK